MIDFESTLQFNPENQFKKTEQPSQPPTEIIGSFSTSKIINTLGGGKERVFAYLKYNQLKVKEYLGGLNQEEFDQLLDLDFQKQIIDNPPIDCVFFPEEELAKIKRLPREQRRDALETFKENLVRQRKALAACRVFIERTIGFNHDTPKEKLLKLVEQFSSSYGFNDRQKQIIEQLIDGYYENRQKVLKIRQQYPDDYKLVKKLTGVKLDKDVKLDVQVGPMSIDIFTDGFNAGRLYERSYKPKLIPFLYGGFFSQSVGRNPVYYIVINQDKFVRKLYNDPTGKKTKMHEYEHIKNMLFREVFKSQESRQLLYGYKEEQDPEIKKVILEDFFKASRAEALERVKNEITACLYDRTLEQLQNQLNHLFFKPESPYDYLKYLRNWEEFNDDPFYQETVQRMLVREYREIIQRSVASYAELVNKGKYSIQEAIALLTDKPLEDWPKTVRRLLE